MFIRAVILKWKKPYESHESHSTSGSSDGVEQKRTCFKVEQGNVKSLFGTPHSTVLSI